MRPLRQRRSDHGSHLRLAGTVDEHLYDARELGETPPPKRYGRRQLWRAGLVGALLGATLAAAGAGYLALRARPELPRLELERRRLALEAELRELEQRSAEIDRRGRVAAAVDGRVEEEVGALREGNLALREAEEEWMQKANAVRIGLRELAGRMTEHAESGAVPAGDRGALVALAAEAEEYAAVLDREIERVKGAVGATAERVGRLDDLLDNRQLRGRAVRVIHDPARADDARRAVELLTAVGADAELFEAEVGDPARHRGRLYYHGEEEAAVARQIARLVADVEAVEPEPVGLPSPFLHLWIVGDPGPVDE